MAGSFWPGLRPASFRGVPFDAFEEHSEAGGRRLVRHEFPLRDTPYAEDMGRKAGQWQVEAFVLRNRWADYEAARNRLRDALNEAGPGTLIHHSAGKYQRGRILQVFHNLCRGREPDLSGYRGRHGGPRGRSREGG